MPDASSVAMHGCPHAMSTVTFSRWGTRLHPEVWLIEVCLTCHAELDRKRMSRGEGEHGTRKSS